MNDGKSLIVVATTYYEAETLPYCWHSLTVIEIKNTGSDSEGGKEFFPTQNGRCKSSD
jgi:hypothetical protein